MSAPETHQQHFAKATEVLLPSDVSQARLFSIPAFFILPCLSCIGQSHVPHGWLPAMLPEELAGQRVLELSCWKNVIHPSNHFLAPRCRHDRLSEYPAAIPLCPVATHPVADRPPCSAPVVDVGTKINFPFGPHLLDLPQPGHAPRNHFASRGGQRGTNELCGNAAALSYPTQSRGLSMRSLYWEPLGGEP